LLLSNVGSSAEYIERFKREARASARIKSNYVVRVTDADVAPELDGAPFLVMDLLLGMDLERAATAIKPTPEVVVAWLRQVALAIDKAHALGIIHRDLKPENLFLANIEGGQPIVKILDFGIAKMIEEGTGGTGSGELLGTPRYMAPEQASPSAKVSSATDRCALGLIAYRLLIGESYYQGGVMVILGQILHDELQPPSLRNPRFGSRFDDWFMKACHRDPAQRFATASEQVQALAEALDLPKHKIEDELAPTVVELARESTPQFGKSPTRRPAIVVLWTAVGLFVAASLAGVLLRSRGSISGSMGTRTESVAHPSPELPAPSPSLATTSPTRMPSQPPTSAVPTMNNEAANTLSVYPSNKPRASRRIPAAVRPVAGKVSTIEKAKEPDPYAEQK
jgi:serine/threonine-protein kinase